MRDDLRATLSLALETIDRPGSFCASGSVPALFPGLEVEGLGPIGLPLTDQQAKELIRRSERAPHGKGEKTVLDPSVRRVWRMKPGLFSLTNPGWDRFIKERVGEVQTELGLGTQKLEAHLHELLLYEPGCFFLPHRDGEKLDRMVATMVIVLPSFHEGGELVVRHDGQERTIDFGSAEGGQFAIHFAAFYADCEHEVRPLRAGHRLCLVYNLTLGKSGKTLTAPRASESIERIRPIPREWAEDDSVAKLIVTLDHQYTQGGLAWDSLKGVDRAKAQALLEAARREGCRAYLGLLTFWESGQAEYSGGGGSGYGRGRRWGSRDEEDDEPHEMGELFDSSLTAEHLIDGDGRGLPIGSLTVEQDEVLDPESLRSIDPEEDFEGFTGNAGMTLERWYRHAAMILWPESRDFEILCDPDGLAAVPVLEQMVARWREAGSGDSAALRARCVDLAATILARWGDHPYGWAAPGGPGNGGIIHALIAIQDPALIGRYLGEVMVIDPSVDPGQAVATACREHGWGTFRRELLTVMSRTNSATMERNVRVLEQIASARPRKQEGWGELVAGLSRDLVNAVEALDRQLPSDDRHSRSVNRANVLAGLVRSLILTGEFELLPRVVAQAQGSPDLYPLKPVQVAALVGLQPWLRKHLKQPFEALTRWVVSCREQLESLTARAPEAPTDYRRPAEITCKCEDCSELRRFLGDPQESVHRFRVRQDRRSHLELRIRAAECDLDLATERQRSPHTLVCTKNQASYEARVGVYQQDREQLATVRLIEASLPT